MTLFDLLLESKPRNIRRRTGLGKRDKFVRCSGLAWRLGLHSNTNCIMGVQSTDRRVVSG